MRISGFSQDVSGITRSLVANFMPESQGPLVKRPTELASWFKVNFPIQEDVLATSTLDFINIKQAATDTAKIFTCTQGFHEWFVKSKSRKLLVHGILKQDVGSDEPSPYSYICAKMMEEIAELEPKDKNPNIIMIAFFCGLWRKKNSPKGQTDTGKGLIVSLIRQLLDRMPDKPYTINGNLRSAEALETAKLGDLCFFFYGLVTQLEQKITLFCIIDSVDEYEDQFYTTSLRLILSNLSPLASCSGTWAAFKLLLVSAGTTERIQKDCDFKKDRGTLIEMYEPEVLEKPLSFKELYAMVGENSS